MKQKYAVETIKLFLLSLFSSFLGYILYVAIGVVLQRNRPNLALVLIQICDLVIVYCIPYGRLWNIGDKDASRCSYNGMEKDTLTGVKIALLATIPYTLLWGALIVSKFIGTDIILQIYRSFTINFVALNTGLLPVESSLKDISFINLIFVYLIPLAGYVGISQIGYVLGFKRISLSYHLTHKNSKEQ